MKMRPTTGVGGFSTPTFEPEIRSAYLLVFRSVKKEVAVVNLSDRLTVGREVPGSKPDIGVDSPIVSRSHGVFFKGRDGFYYQDTDSFNGTFINGVLYQKDINSCTTPIKLRDGDVIRFDSRDKRKSHAEAVTIVFSSSYDKRSKWISHKITAENSTAGVSDKGVLDFKKDRISFPKATVTVQDTGCMVQNISHRESLSYANRFVDGTCFVRNKDVFCVERSYVFYDEGSVLYNICLVSEPGLEIHLAETHVADKMKKKVLLKDINMSVDKGDFVLIIGGSGAGKSTFMNSILGKYDITGTIKIGGAVSHGASELTSGIAYVPQTLPLRKEERLIDVVTDTCMLRCKRKMSKAQREKFILDSLDSVGLKSKAKTEIKKLSGGEQRRAAIANEVVTDADIFFLDEPDSGLDPKSGMELMNNLKALSDVGKIVMLISHNYASYPNPKRIYTKVVILAKSNKDGIGRLAFYGTVKEALEFFEVKELKDITKMINPVSENGEGRADEFVEKYRRMYGE